jgi:tetratricopeptide (TPR) repeat protein
MNSPVGRAGRVEESQVRSMTPNSGKHPPSDRALRIALRIGVAVLVLGLVAFGSVYYLSQRAVAGPSLSQRQISSAEQAVRGKPNSVAARLALAQAYETAHRFDDAIRQYDEILRAVPDHRTALLGRAGALFTKGDLDSAAAGYQKLTSTQAKGEFAGADPQLEEAHYYLAVIDDRKGRAEQAITEAKAALKIEPTDSDAWYELGSAQLRAGQAPQAVNSLKQALLFVPTGWCEPYGQLAQAYRTLKQTPQADYSTAMVDVCQKRYDAARTRLLTLTSGPVAADALVGLGTVAESTGRQGEAIDWYRKALAVQPTNTTAITGLSRLGIGPTGTPSAKAAPAPQGAAAPTPTAGKG